MAASSASARQVLQVLGQLPGLVPCLPLTMEAINRFGDAADELRLLAFSVATPQADVRWIDPGWAARRAGQGLGPRRQL